MAQSIPATPMVELYDALHAKGVSRREKLDRARGLLTDPRPLIDAFARSVEIVEGYTPHDEGFYRSRRRYAVGEVKASSTTDLALRVRDAGGLDISADQAASLPASIEARSLSCDYLDRELVATRTTGGASHAGTAVRLDLLLASRADRTPIVAEVKRTSDTNAKATDKDPFSALIQALACVSQLATPAQYARLGRWGAVDSRGPVDVPGRADIAPASVPTFDVYLVPTTSLRAPTSPNSPRPPMSSRPCC